MARIAFTSMVEEIIGKLAGSVFQDSYMGIQIRTRASPRNPSSYFSNYAVANLAIFLQAGVSLPACNRIHGLILQQQYRKHCGYTLATISI